jgi:ribosomal protein S18 acetylase RimI-like enzyme
MEIRTATADDREFLVDMLFEAYNWSGRNEVLRTDLPTDRYVAGWPRSGDLGVIAVENGRRVGAAWARTLTADDPGYGYVADDVPELSIGVVSEARGRGVGRALLTALIESAREAGLERISLSVEPDNRAVELYRSLGFAAVGRSGGSDTMVLDLRTERAR